MLEIAGGIILGGIGLAVIVFSLILLRDRIVFGRWWA